MKSNFKNEIINLLSTGNRFTASTLANHFNISEKTVRNYIQEINSDEIFIVSNNKGYKICSPPKTIKKDNIPTTQYERIFFLVRNLIQKNTSVSVTDLCEQLCISMATLSKDLAVLKGQLSNYTLSFKNSRGYISLIGEELNKRKLILGLLVDKTTQNVISIDSILASTNIKINPSSIRELITSALKKNNLFLNDYSLTNIILHVIIAINRLSQNSTIQTPQLQNFSGFEDEKNTAKEICFSIFEKYNVRFNEDEINQLAFLLITKASSLHFRDLDKDNLSKVLGNEYLNLALEIVKKVNNHYLIDINDDEFIIKFSLHLKNVLFRVSHGYQETNPLTQRIKKSHPLVYDISAFISMEIKNTTGYSINEDEIAFIAFHIGSIIERKNQISHKIKCVLIYQNYNDMLRSILVNLNNKFSESLEIIETVTTIDLVTTSSFDMILSTDYVNYTGVPVLNISPILSSADYININNQIEKLKSRKDSTTVSNYFETFFEERLFECNHYFDNCFSMIKYMAHRLEECGYADSKFVEGVIEREKVAATSFDNFIAIPHSINTSTSKNCSCVIINKKQMKWGQYQVRVVILIGINENERDLFNELYTSLLNHFEKPEYVNKLINCDSYNGLISLLTEEVTD